MAGVELKTAVVTGATRGIGLAIADALVKAGARVLIGARNQDSLDSVCARLTSSGGSVSAQMLDLSDFGSIDTFCDAAREEFADLNILVLCAGTYEHSAWDMQMTDALRLAMNVKVLGNARLAENVLPSMSTTDGHIVFINSSIVRGDGKGNPAHAASQHALRSMADSLRASVNAKGIRVTTIYPGKTATPRQASIATAAGRQYQPDDIIQAEDVALAVLQCLEFPHRTEVTDLHMRQTKKV